MSKTKTKKSSGWSDWVDNKLTPAMGKFGNQRHLSSIRDGFALVTPLIIAGAIGIIIVTMIFGGWGAGQSSLLGMFSEWGGKGVSTGASAAADGSIPVGPTTGWLHDLNGNGELQASQFESEGFAKASYIGTSIFAQLNNAGIGTLSIIFAFSLGYFLSQSRQNDNPVMGGMVSLGAFLIATAGDNSYYGANGILTAILIGIFAVEIYCYASKSEKLKFQMPNGVPPAVARSFAKLFPVIIAVLSTGLLFTLVALPTYLTNAQLLSTEAVDGVVSTKTIQPPNGYWSLGDLVFSGIQAPIAAIASLNGANVGIAVFYVLGVGFLWFFGLHGTNVMNGGFQAVWTMLLVSNTAMLQDHGYAYLNENGAIFAQGTFDAYVFFGGTEATMGLLIATFIFSKRSEEREIAKFALPAGVFNINEPVVFGYPLVANLSYAIPTIFTMPALVLTTWMGYAIFGTNLVAVQIPWTAPIGIGALFATNFDYSSFIIAIINLAVTLGIWTPFVILNTRQKGKAEKVGKDNKVKNEVKEEKTKGVNA